MFGLKLVVITALCFSDLTLAEEPQSHQERAVPGVCSSGIYGELSVLAYYPPAVSYCAQRFPVKCTSAKSKRSMATKLSTVTSKASSTISATDERLSAYSKCLKQPAHVVSTICSCIQVPKVSLRSHLYIFL